MLYYTNHLRKHHIDEITRLIDVLGSIKSDELSYLDYRRTIAYLAELRNEIVAEMTND